MSSNLKPHFRRITRSDWGTSTTLSLTEPNVQGCACIALGPLDQSGGVILTAQTGNNLCGQTAVIGPQAPFIGQIDGPFILTPLITPVGSIFASTLDLLIYECVPQLIPLRPPLRQTSIITNTQGYVNTIGRKNIGITVYATGTSNTFTIYTLSFGTGAGVGIIRTIATVTTGAQNATYNFSIDPGVAPLTPATGEKLVPSPDMIEFSAADANTTLNYVVTGQD